MRSIKEINQSSKELAFKSFDGNETTNFRSKKLNEVVKKLDHLQEEDQNEEEEKCKETTIKEPNSFMTDEENFNDEKHDQVTNKVHDRHFSKIKDLE